MSPPCHNIEHIQGFKCQVSLVEHTCDFFSFTKHVSAISGEAIHYLTQTAMLSLCPLKMWLCLVSYDS